MASNLVVVESPAKARTIEKYLGPDFEVLASYGHVRDLVPKGGAVEPNNDFYMHYEAIERNEKHVVALSRAMKKADTLYLATDPDREGEAIAWHVVEILKERKALDSKPVHRVVFHEITKRAVQDAVAHSREISMELVNAQQARRALDYLVGFNLSPLLWKKIRRGLSAGRVQSPALRLIVEREEEIERFVKREYWTVEADLAHSAQAFVARLTHVDGDKLEQFSIVDEARATELEARIGDRAAGRMRVAKVEKKQRRRNPLPPFMTSTLQQDAARRLGFTAQRTMRVAQQLYEGADVGAGAVGLITYMRTDSLTLANEALTELRSFIGERFGAHSLPDGPRVYKNKSKNAQEAHEAIRPTSAARVPETLRARLSPDQYRLYQLIWKRTVACQMQHALIDTVAVDLTVGGTELDLAAAPEVFRATGSSVASPGFLAVYEDGAEESEPGATPQSGSGSTRDDRGEPGERRLPVLEVGDVTTLTRLRPEQHFTEPPPRFSEATLIRALEEFGIGRPSTYATIIQTLQNREYVETDRRRFQPTDIGRVVNGYLTEHFSTYVDYEFTARLEDDLDAISRGERDWKPLMRDFWTAFEERVRLKETESGRPAARQLGIDPASGRPVTVRMGRYGPHVQIGSAEDDEKPKFAGLRPGQRMNDVTLEEALPLFKLPRQLGETPDGDPISVSIGRFGPYTRYGSKFVSLASDDDPYTITLERALELIEEKKLVDAQRTIKVFEEEGISILNGRYGPYVTDGNKNARVPKDREPPSLTLSECRELIAAAPVSRGNRRKKKATAKKKPVAKKQSAQKKAAPKKSAKKKSTKKSATKKKSAKKKSAEKTGPASD